MAEKTLEELVSENAELTSKVSGLLAEAAKYRTERNASLREAHALRTIAQAHSVNVADVVTASKLEPLTIENGEVQGEFDYQAPSLKQAKDTKQQKQIKADPGTTAITAESLAKMSTSQINERWADVSNYLSAASAIGDLLWTIAAIVPTIWAARFETILSQATVFGARTNANFEGSLSDGDTVKIPFFGGGVTVTDYDEDGTFADGRAADPDEIVAGTLDLVCRQRKQFGFVVEDIEQVQSRPNLIDAAMGESVRKVSTTQDSYLRGIFDGANSNVSVNASRGVAASTIASRRVRVDAATAVDADDGAFGKALIKGVASLKQKMTLKNIPETGRWLVVHPDTIYGLELWALDKTSTGVYLPATSESTLRNGFAGRLLGFDLYVSSDLAENTSSPYSATNDAWRLYAGQGNEAVTMANQIRKVEALRRQDAFADYLRGLYVLRRETGTS